MREGSRANCHRDEVFLGDGWAPRRFPNYDHRRPGWEAEAAAHVSVQPQNGGMYPRVAYPEMVCSRWQGARESGAVNWRGARAPDRRLPRAEPHRRGTSR